MRILAIERSGLYYGSAVNLKNWIEYYVNRKNYKVDVLIGECGEIESEIESAGGNILRKYIPNSINKYGKKNIGILNSLKTAFYLMLYNIKVIREYNDIYECIVVNNYRSAIYYAPFLIYLKLFKSKKIVTRFQISQRPIEFLSKIVTWFSEKIIVHGTEGYCEREFGKDFYKNDKVICIPNPVNTSRFYKNEIARQTIREELGVDKNSFVFISVCYIEPRKGILQLVQAFSELNLDNCYLIHLGDQGTHYSYLDQVKAVANEKVIFLGKKQNISSYYSAADVFVLNSKYEGMPYVIVEAMASELPILSTYAGSNEEVVTSKVGSLVKYDDNDALKREMIKMYEGSEALLSLGKEARKVVEEKYSEDMYFKKLSEIY